MPYIKKEMRPIFDLAVHLARKEPTTLVLKCIKFAVKDMAPKVMDGCLNYVFTQLLRRGDLPYAGGVIEMTLNDLFWKKPNYFGFERVKGLLGCMVDEYRRRAWQKQREVVKVLKEILKRNAFLLSHYEEEKIRLNGDLE